MKTLLQWATGLGKTKAALDMCKQVYTTNKKALYVLIQANNAIDLVLFAYFFFLICLFFFVLSPYFY